MYVYVQGCLAMYVCSVYVCKHVSLWVHVHVCPLFVVCLHAYIQLCICATVFIGVCVSVCLCLCMCDYEGLCVCVGACMQLYVCMFALLMTVVYSLPIFHSTQIQFTLRDCHFYLESY